MRFFFFFFREQQHSFGMKPASNKHMGSCFLLPLVEKTCQKLEKQLCGSNNVVFSIPHPQPWCGCFPAPFKPYFLKGFSGNRWKGPIWRSDAQPRLDSLFCMLHLVVLIQSGRGWGTAGQEGLEISWCRAQQLLLKLQCFATGRELPKSCMLADGPQWSVFCKTNTTEIPQGTLFKNKNKKNKPLCK